jgi:hypothetical protein
MAGEPKAVDSEFYLAGALGLLLAMLGWADQIRGTQERTRQLEKELLEEYGFRWTDLRHLVRPSEGTPRPEQRLAALLRVLKAGKLKDSLDVGLLRQLETLNGIRARLERRYDFRFWLVFATSVEMFVAGVSLMLTNNVNPSVSIPLHPLRTVVWNIPLIELSGLGCVALIGSVLYQTWRLNRGEETLRRVIGDVDDQLRQAKDTHSAAGRG